MRASAGASTVHFRPREANRREEAFDNICAMHKCERRAAGRGPTQIDNRGTQGMRTYDRAAMWSVSLWRELLTPTHTRASTHTHQHQRSERVIGAVYSGSTRARATQSGRPSQPLVHELRACVERAPWPMWHHTTVRTVRQTCKVIQVDLCATNSSQ